MPGWRRQFRPRWAAACGVYLLGPWQSSSRAPPSADLRAGGFVLLADSWRIPAGPFTGHSVGQALCKALTGTEVADVRFPHCLPPSPKEKARWCVLG